MTITGPISSICEHCQQPAVLAAFIDGAHVCADCVDWAIEAAILDEATREPPPD